ncbi:helix-turn-helix domain-containing protein [Roseovarius sp. B08]|uniref:helix-turn-helix domain-containing protein n=1 Tax=Roseovarius sp. B08 TaxID=3449223 RepID=UPI003EDBC469
MNGKTRSAGPSKQVADPAVLRGIFGRNLQILSAPYRSVSGLCRDIGINRTQFNRYLSGESFPRPDLLHRICEFFNVDARILLEPVEAIFTTSPELLGHAFLSDFFGTAPTAVPEEMFPSGFYSFVRRSFIDDSLFTIGLVHVHREAPYTFMRGFEPRDAMRSQGLSTEPANREFRGLVMRQEEGVAALVTHRNSLACSFNFLTPETSFQSNIWEGYATRTVREKVTGRRAARMVYEYLGPGLVRALPVARQAGLVTLEDVPVFHARLLRLNEEFR